LIDDEARDIRLGFCRDGDADSTEFVIYSRPDSHRLKHLRERPDKVSFHFDSDGHGQDIVVLHGRVVVDDDHPLIQDWPPYLEKYGPAVERVFGSIAKFSESYPIALRVTITGVRGFYVVPVSLPWGVVRRFPVPLAA
jgi:PPOX class probable F420-dependent enzyme